MSSTPLALTLDEAASALRVSKGTLRALVDKGELPTVRVGPRTPRISAAALERFLEQRSTTSPTG